MVKRQHLTTQSLVIVSSLEHHGPYEEAAGDEGEHGGCHLQVPRVREVVDEGVGATEPEVFTLQTEGIVCEDHDGHHDEHT